MPRALTTGSDAVLVDAENVRRSVWPNISRRQLVELCSAWATHHGTMVIVVFDGAAPELATLPLVGVVSSGSESADDVLSRMAIERVAEGETVWVVTSDRALRGRVHEVAALVGGGTFARELLSLDG